MNKKVYKNWKEVIDLMKDGWSLEEKRNYNNTFVLSYWLGKKGENIEHCLTAKTRNTLLKKSLIDSNNDLINSNRPIPSV